MIRRKITNAIDCFVLNLATAQSSIIDSGEQITLLSLFQQVYAVTEVLSEIKPLKIQGARGLLEEVSYLRLRNCHPAKGTSADTPSVK